MRNDCKQKFLRKLTVVGFLGLIAYFTLTNASLNGKAFGPWLRGENTLDKSISAAQNIWANDNFKQRMAFLDINGLYARLTARRVLNESITLSNGHLTRVYEHPDTIPAHAAALIHFSDEMKRENIPFIFLLAPYKLATDENLMPAGLDNAANRDADQMLELLADSAVETIDMRPLVSATGELISRYYYRVDHYWTPEASFLAYRELLTCLQRIYSDVDPELTQARLKNWNIQTFPNESLGSLGTRVGQFFSGKSDDQMITPNFDTAMSLTVIDGMRIAKGSFNEAELSEKDGTDYFAYTGGNWGISQHRNAAAPIKRHLLLIKDSFGLPIQSFLATVFQAVDVITPRAFSDMTIMEYAQRTHPDAVVLLVNQSLFYDPVFFDYGEPVRIDAEIHMKEVPVEMEISPAIGNYNCGLLTSGFENNRTYRLSVEALNISDPIVPGVSLHLFDSTSSEMVWQGFWDASYCTETGGCESYFHTPLSGSADLDLMICPGRYGGTWDIGASLSGITLEEMDAE